PCSEISQSRRDSAGRGRFRPCECSAELCGSGGAVGRQGTKPPAREELAAMRCDAANRIRHGSSNRGERDRRDVPCCHQTVWSSVNAALIDAIELNTLRLSM